MKHRSSYVFNGLPLKCVLLSVFLFVVVMDVYCKHLLYCKVCFMCRGVDGTDGGEISVLIWFQNPGLTGAALCQRHLNVA